ncbi:MAG TPA: PadR family transcriptional regulator [Dehalococcoidia bacterium]|nr:PadR family transcriptional regulator [Dehalococcoidia bacterium]
MKGEALKGHLDLILLAALEAGPTYGYSIAARVASATGGNVTLSDGTIYTALHRLEHAGLLTSRYMTSKGRRRRVYSLTDRGWQESARLRREWWDFARGLEVLLQPGR